MLLIQYNLKNSVFHTLHEYLQTQLHDMFHKFVYILQTKLYIYRYDHQFINLRFDICYYKNLLNTKVKEKNLVHERYIPEK